MLGLDGSVEEFITAVLRGASTLLGCNSTNLVLINAHSGQMRVRVGASMASESMLSEIEQLLGRTFSRIALGIESASDSLIYACFSERRIVETSSLAELVGSAFPKTVTAAIEKLIGQRRYVCVPAQGDQFCYGVLLFEKPGALAFSRQQREVLSRYARRIGELLELDPTGQRRELLAQNLLRRQARLLFDDEGALIGQEKNAERLPKTLIAQVERAIRAADDDLERADVEKDELARLGLSFSPFYLDGQRCTLCTIDLPAKASDDASLENLLLQLSLAAPAPALFLDRARTITSANAAAEQLFGRPQSELCERPLRSLFCQPERLEEILGQRLLDPRFDLTETPATAVCKDGNLSTRTLEILMLADDRKRPLGFLLLLRERNPAADANEGLLLEERLATMGEMAAQLAHELRNPLLAIGATLESLTEEVFDPEQRKTLKMACAEIGRLDALLKTTMAQVQRKSRVRVPLRPVVEDAVDLLAHGKAAEIPIEVDIAAELAVFGDREGMQQLVFNLLLNAVEASSPGQTVSCRAYAGQNELRLIVDDQGMGLTAGPENCLKPFFTTKHNGTGLGLAICDKIAKAHGGAISLSARDGGGTRALVMLPRDTVSTSMIAEQPS
jgi:signal transduction histidine kinase